MYVDRYIGRGTPFISRTNSFVAIKSFLLVLFSLVVPAGYLKANTQSFTNATSITIPDSGSGSPYPSSINVAGITGTITNATITLNGFNHSWASDVDMLLVGPAGQKILIVSDVGDGFSPSNLTLTLSDAAASSLPSSGAFTSGTYKPTDYSANPPGTDTFPAPAPASPYATTLSVLNGTDPTGTWSLFIVDDGAGDQGNLSGGWTLTITTNGPASPTLRRAPTGASLLSTSATSSCSAATGTRCPAKTRSRPPTPSR